MISSRAEEGLHNLATDIRDALRKHESGEVQTKESKNGTTVNVYNYGAKPVSRFSFFSTVGIIVTMILCGIALAIGWTLITKPELILNWFGI